jgi:hypothetical protein
MVLVFRLTLWQGRLNGACVQTYVVAREAERRLCSDLRCGKGGGPKRDEVTGCLVYSIMRSFITCILQI